MASPTLLLSLLLASLAAVHSVPLEKGEHPEELVTRCIVEVLSNALGKANAPPINPQCKEILKKSGHQEKVEKKSDGGDVQYEERHLTAPSDAEVQQHMNEEQHHQNEEAAKSYLEDNEEKRHEEEEERQGEGDKRHSLDKDFSNEEDNHNTGNYQPSKKRSEGTNENGNDKVHYNSEEKKHLEEVSEKIQPEHSDKRPHSAGRSMEAFSNEEGDDKRSAPYNKHSDEWMQSSEKRSRGSEEESSEVHSQQIKRHDSRLSKEYEESDESKDMEKRYYKQRPYHRNPRHHKSTEDKRISHLEKRYRGEESEESDDEDAHYNNKKGYSAQNYDEWTYGNNHHPRNQEKRNSYESQSSEEVDKKRHQSIGSEEEWEKRSEERDEEKGYSIGENEEKRHHYEKKRQPYWDLQPEYEEKGQHIRENQKKTYNYYAKSSPEMKKRYQESTEDDESDRQYSKENKEEKKHYFVEENMAEEKRYYPVKEAEEQGIEKRYHSEEKKSNVEESEEEMKSQDRVRFKPYYNEDIDKRAVRQFNPYNKYLWWNNRRFEKRRNLGSQITDSEDANKHKMFLPEYNDYDLWEKRQLMQDMNPDYTEKTNPSIIHKFDNKRQYNKMEELAQLLNYKKKSVELPDLYNSEEGFKKRHMMQTKKRNLIQRPLTEEEEKELQNLAAMDLELQKIAEKLNDNRRG
ncbi:secretogranin-1 isoform X1 [Pleurodeles waltl]|uniref:secretogranin-1 isoform X1 n=2 Tax=Pleurodeles waltl TaxID=8319 RepID=UPI00370986BA